MTEKTVNFKDLEATWDEIGAWYYTLNNVLYVFKLKFTSRT